ncbi:MAG TPA: DUF1059 domain-containing protein [Chitinivibrionales bacterium]|nr:DUF1059 domain-containing protein [Chitinivibrionales bacterium]
MYLFTCTPSSDLTLSGGCGEDITGPSLDEVVSGVVAHFHAEHGFAQIEAYNKEEFEKFRKKVAEQVKKAR